MIDQILPGQQELHDAKLAPLLEKRNEIAARERVALDVYIKAADELDDAHELYWSQFEAVALAIAEATLLGNALETERREPDSGIEPLIPLGQIVAIATYLGHRLVADIGALVFETRDWPIWSEELERLRKAEDEAISAYDPIDLEFTAINDQITALESDNPTRERNQVAAEIFSVEGEKKSPRSRN